jgi:hypothetical protein
MTRLIHRLAGDKRRELRLACEHCGVRGSVYTEDIEPNWMATELGGEDGGLPQHQCCRRFAGDESALAVAVKVDDRKCLDGCEVAEEGSEAIGQEDAHTVSVGNDVVVILREGAGERVRKAGRRSKAGNTNTWMNRYWCSAQVVRRMKSGSIGAPLQKHETWLLLDWD